MDSKTVPLSSIHHFASHNIARPNGLFRDERDQHALVEQLADGWDIQQGVVAIAPMNEKEQAEAVKELTAEREALKNADLSAEAEKIRVNGETVAITAPELLRVFENVYLDKEGKIIVPTYKGGTCFRRTASMLKVNTVRAKRSLGLITELPCIVKDYKKSLDQFIDNVAENQKKTAGARKMSNADSIGAARSLFRLNATEAKLSKAFSLKRGMAQKMHRLCQLDKEHKGLGIIDKIVSGDLDPKAFDKEKVKALLDNKATSEQVAEFIKAPNAGNKAKIMPRKDIEALKEQTPVELVALTCQAILQNDPLVLKAVTDRADAINKAVATEVNG